MFIRVLEADATVTHRSMPANTRAAGRIHAGVASLKSSSMPNLAECPNHWDPKSKECKAIIETPKGRRTKFHYDPEYQAFALKTLLPKGLVFPYDFGFIPSTQGGDGDPLDLMLLMDEPAHVGCLVQARIIGVIEAEQTEEGKSTGNDRLIGVPITSFSRQDIQTIDEVSQTILDQVEEFFVSYNKSRGKEFKVKGRHGPERAAAIVDAGIAAFRKKRKT